MGGFNTNFESGVLDDFDFTVTNAMFATDARYNNGETIMLQLEGTTDNPDIRETHLWFTCGKGWVSKDGGATIVHESGKDGKNFNRSCKYARLIQRCLDDFGIGDVLDGRGDPWTASTWVGLRFHVNNEQIDYGTGIESKPTAMPTAFLGVVDGGESVSAETPAEKIARVKAEKAKAGAGGGDLKSRVLETLRGHDDFSAGQAAALEIDGVTDDDEILNSLMDEDGLWAESRS